MKNIILITSLLIIAIVQDLNLIPKMVSLEIV